MKPVIAIIPFSHKTTPLIKLSFQGDKTTEQHLKQLDFVYYSQLYSCYYTRFRNEYLERLFNALGQHVIFNIDKIKKRGMGDVLNRHRKSFEPSLPVITLSLANKACYLLLPTPYQRQWVVFIHGIGGVYEYRRRIWVIENYATKRLKIHTYFEQQGCKIQYNNQRDIKVLSHLKRSSQALDKELLQLKKVMTLQGAQKRTIDNYLSQLNKLKNYYEGKSITAISDDEIQDYLFFLREELSYSRSAQNIAISAIKRFLLSFTERELDTDKIPRPKTGRQLPKILDKKEVEAILKQQIYLKHKCILTLLYAAGLRCDELIKLKVIDIKFDNNIITVKNGKGDKSRIVPLAAKLKDMLLRYIRKERPLLYLFEGQHGGTYSASSIQKILKRTAVKAGIDKRVTPHMLRHSFATHLHDKGVDIRNIQRLLGHSSTKTTEIYTHISKRDISQLKSPLDDLDV
ncbi:MULTISPECIES: site-specific tyrosine recombinase/integron integrase [unclassified Carboxylicivirga]|uniref:site-specific tyrosine recombinase/integron integrase n=1 Tax=Carboxylicivirga TaxID=1628153 RepID=UPI003D32EFFC